LFLSGENRTAILCLVLVLLTLALYNPVVRNNFIDLDDYRYITQNVHVRGGLSWETVKWAFRSYDEANWHPLTWLSHALDCQLFKLNPAGHHYETVLLHAANAVLLFLLLLGATGFTWPSFMVAALFALHPVNVESVAWAAERKNVLSMLFFLLAMNAYGWYVRRQSIGRYGAVVVLFALGLMAKPEIITLPFVLLLWDYWPLRRMDRGPGTGDPITGEVGPSFLFLVMEKAPLFLLSAGSAVVTYLAQRNGETMRKLAAPWRLGNAVVACVRYIGKAFWPTRLAVLYPHPGHSLPVWQIVASAIGLVAVTALFVHWRNRRYLLVGWLWFLGTLVPVIGIVQVGVQAMADRYAYLPYIGLFVCVVWGVAEMARERKVPAAAVIVSAILVLASLSVVSRRQIGYWHDSESLWRHTLSVTSDENYIAHDGLAKALALEGRSDDAIAEFKKAEMLNGYSPLVMTQIGAYEQAQGHPQDAIEEYGRVLDAATDASARADALSSLGDAFAQTGDFQRAKSSYASALRENPNEARALVGNGLLAERDGDAELAAAQISRAMQVAPTDVGYLLLGQALHRGGRLSEAEEAYARARQISSNPDQARQRAAQVMASVGINWER
jgi:Flp pilus assembly protein TadD